MPSIFSCISAKQAGKSSFHLLRKTAALLNRLSEGFFGWNCRQKRRQGACQLRRFLQLCHQPCQLQGRGCCQLLRLLGLGQFWRAHRPQIGIGAGVEGALELLGVHLPVLIQDMGIHAGNHVDLRMARVALGGLRVVLCDWPCLKLE